MRPDATKQCTALFNIAFIDLDVTAISDDTSLPSPTWNNLDAYVNRLSDSAGRNSSQLYGVYYMVKKQ